MRPVHVATVASLLVLAIVTALVVPQLPDPVATHFGVDGMADDFGPRAAAWPLVVGVTTIVAGILTAITWTTRTPPAGMGWLLGLPVGVVWGVGGVMLATLVPQMGRADAVGARVSPWVIVLALAVGVLVTAGASRLANLDMPPATTAPAPQAAVRADLPDDRTALWHGHSPTGRGPVLLAGGIAIAGVVAGIYGGWWLTTLLVAVAGVVVASTTFATTIGPRGIHVVGSVLGWPRVTVPLDTVTSAQATRIRPRQFGGWGVRMQPGLATTAVVTTAGPALELHRTDDSRLLVSLDDAAEAAAVVTTLLDRRAQRPTGPGGAGHHEQRP